MKRSTVKKLPTALPRDAEDTKLLAQVIEYYHQTLLQSPEALEYLAQRGLSSSEARLTRRRRWRNRLRLPRSSSGRPDSLAG